MDSLVLREENHSNINICDECHDIYNGLNHHCLSSKNIKLVIKGTKKCNNCETQFFDIKDEPYGDRYIPLVVVGKCTVHGTFFKNISDEDIELIQSAKKLSHSVDFGDLRGFDIPRGPKSDDLLNRGIQNFLELFTPRQVVYLNKVIQVLPDLEVEDRLWMALLVSTSLDFNSLLCGYKGSGIRRPGAIRHVFSHHAYSFPYTALENNPLNSINTSGTLNRLFGDRIRKACLWSSSPLETKIIDNVRKKVTIEGEMDGGEPAIDWLDLQTDRNKFIVLQGDAARINIPENFVDFIVTDPPYFDSVQYSDLSNFFRVWLRRFLPQDADWKYDQLASAVSEGDGNGHQKYGEKLTAIWKTCHRAIKKRHGRLIFTFHHWRHNAWAELTISLRRAKFILVNRYVVHSENPISVHIMGLKALKHDCILVLSLNSAFTQNQEWNRPAEIIKEDSYSFCKACGSALGWFLMSDLSEDKIRYEWKRLLEVNGNGKTSC